jgi:hypothetical protein
LDQKRILIGVPSGNQVHADFAFSMMNLIIYSFLQKLEVGAVNRKGSIIAQNRCALVDVAREIKATHILFLDSDHVVPKDLLIKLLAHDKDIVGVHQPTKLKPCRSNVEDLKGQRLTKVSVGLEEVSRCGTGIMLISLKVFDAMKRPYFNTIYKDGMMDKVRGWHGEDYYFCEAARHKGFQIFVDHDVSKECFHIGQQTYGVEDLC